MRLIIKFPALAIAREALWLSGKESTCQCSRRGFESLGQDDPLKEEMATHSSIYAWEIPRTEEPGRLQATVHGVSKGRTRLKQLSMLEK